MRFRRSMPQRLWGAVLVAASISSCAPPKDEEHAAPQPAPAAVAASPAPSPSPAYDPPGMTPQQVQSRIEAGEKVAIVDVRSKSSYTHGHIKGALSIPWRDLEKGYKQLPKDYLIALYCTWPAEHTARGAASDLHDKYGYTRLAVLLGGLSAWEAAGYPVVKASAKPAAVPVSGRSLYAQHCATCHQLDGLGMPGHYPALAGNGVATMADPRALALVTLNGLRPAPTASGQPQPAEMPGFAAQLNDGEIASILTFVRSEWGNRAGKVTPADVRAMRTKP